MTKTSMQNLRLSNFIYLAQKCMLNKEQQFIKGLNMHLQRLS